MDNNNASVSVPDFTRGHWNDIKGFRHAFASAEDEAAAEEAAAASTKAQKDAAAEYDLWTLYDNMKKDPTSSKAQKAYKKAVEKAQKAVEKAMKKYL